MEVSGDKTITNFRTEIGAKKLAEHRNNTNKYMYIIDIKKKETILQKFECF